MEPTTEAVAASLMPTNGKELSGTERVLAVTVMSVIQITGVLTNVLAIFTLLRSPKAKLSGLGFVVTLCFSDLLFIGISFPFAIESVWHGFWPYSRSVCVLQGFLLCYASAASVGNITFIAISRYLSVVHSTSYRNLKNSHLLILIACAWIYAALIVVPSVSGWSRVEFSLQLDSCVIDWTYNWAYTYFVGATVFIIPLTVIGYCYIRIFYVFWASKSKFARTTQDSRNKSSPKDIKLAVQLLVLLLTYLVCWGPYFCLVILIDHNGDMDRSYYDAVANVIVLGAIIDPIIYFFFNKTLREEAKLLFCCRKRNAVHDNITNTSTG